MYMHHPPTLHVTEALTHASCRNPVSLQFLEGNLLSKIFLAYIAKISFKNFFREIAFLAVLPSSKIHFWPFLKLEKNGIW